MLLLCLTLSEESKPCLQLSLLTVVLSSSVSQILLLKVQSFKKSTRLIANLYAPSLLKFKPSPPKNSLVMLTLLMNWILFLLHSSCKKSLTCLIILVNVTCFLMNIYDIITTLTPRDKHVFPMFILRFTIFFHIYLVNYIMCNITGSYVNDCNIWSIFYQGGSNKMV